MALNRIEEHLAECKERVVECKEEECGVIMKASDKARHDEQCHPVIQIEQCDECGGSYA